MSKKLTKKYCVVWEYETVTGCFLDKVQAITKAKNLMLDDTETFEGATVYVCEVIGSVSKPPRMKPEFIEAQKDD